MKKSATTTARKDIYATITDEIIAKVEAGGQLPWRQSWRTSDGGFPTNLVSKKPYRGINVMILAMARYTSSYWLTYKQAVELGGSVKKGEKATMVCFWSFPDRTNEDEKTRAPFLRQYHVFNLSQCEGLDLSKIPAMDTREIVEDDRTAAGQAIVDGYKGRPEVLTGYNQACYIPSLDVVHMPDRNTFTSDAEYFGVLYHEFSHSSASPSRLGRMVSGEKRCYADAQYSLEEITAEVSACLLLSEASLLFETLDNSCAYVQGWLKTLKNDKTLLLKGCGLAAKAADYILGRQSVEAAE